MDGMEYLWNIAGFGNHFSNFLLGKRSISLQISLLLPLKGRSFHLSHTWANHLFLNEPQHSHPENKPFHFQVDPTVLFS